MNDSDPRPMPVEVQRAYREPVDLHGLLMSSVYSEQDRRDVLDALMRLLLEKHGDVWISAGSKETRVSTRIKQTKKSIVKAIELLSSVEEYGGSDGVLPLLAQAMQPKWAQWWESFFWNEGNIYGWHDVAGSVLGERQSVWLAAQYARTVIDVVRPRDRDVCVRAIEVAELWARVPSEANRTKARSAALSAYEAGRLAAALDATYAAYTAYYAAIAATATSATWAAAAAAADASVSAAAADAADASDAAATANATARAVAYTRLADLTRNLITPTLVTSAARSSGTTRAHSSRA